MQSSDIRTSSASQIYKYKLVFVGDQSVGKTSIIGRFIYDNFSGSDQPTVGIDFISKTLHIDNKTIRLQLWDTAGQERFRSLIPSYVRDSNAVIIVYDITNPASFNSIANWLQYVKEERGTDVVLALLGNKIDISEKRQVTTESGEAKAKENDMLFFEVSAKSGVNVPQAFKSLISQLQGLGDVNQSQIVNNTQSAVMVNNPEKTINLTNTPGPAETKQGGNCGC